MASFTHIDEKGRVRMVDVTEKPPTVREAVAQGLVSMTSETFEKIQNQSDRLNCEPGNETFSVAKRISITACRDLKNEYSNHEANIYRIHLNKI